MQILEDKTKEQLIQELKELHQRITELTETKLEQAVNKLREERKTAQNYLNIAEVILVVINIDQKVTFINKKGCEILGYSEDEIVSKNWFDNFIPEWQRDRVKECFTKLMAGNIELLEYFENPVLSKGGEEKIIAWHNSLLKDEKENIIAILSSGEDITKRKQTEKALCESEERYRKLFQQSVEAIYMFDPETKRIIEANNAFLNLLGYTAEELCTLTLYDFVVHKRENIDVYIYQILTSGAIIIGELLWRRKDKTMVDVWVTASKIKQKEKALCFVVAHDITKQKRAEEALRESEERLRSLADAAFEGIIFHMGGILLRANDQFFKIFGYKQDELLGKQIVHKLVAPEAQEFTKEQIAGGKPDPYESIGVRKDGTKFPIEIRERTTELQGRKIRVATILDITERKKTEEALKKEALRRKVLMAKSNDGIAIINQDHKVVETNQRFADMLGYTPEEVIGLHTWDWEALMTEAEIRASFADLTKTNIVFETRHRRKDGTTFDVEVSASGTKVGDEPMAFTICRDITERKQAEEKLLAAKERLETLSKSSLKTLENERRYIAKELHDEIGQELTAITIHLENMQYLPNSTVYKNHINEGIAIVERLIQKVRNLSFDLRPPILDDLGLSPALRWYLKRLDKEGGLSIHFIDNSSDHRMPMEIETACFRVVQEALTNVVRHAKARQVTIELKQEEKELQLTVSDDGIGFDVKSAKRQALLGESFGLLGMQERVALVGGRIDIESMPSKGTKVIAFFTLSEY
jgi:PAS domain S-box-containing protein